MRSIAAPVRTAHHFVPDLSRVIARPYLPAGELSDPEPRTARLVRRVLALSDEQVESRLEAVRRDFDGRHSDLARVLRDNYAHVLAQLVHRGNDLPDPSDQQQMLIGAYATHEFTIQAAGFFNPSMVPAPDQRGAAPGECRFVMSARSVGEGHLSCIEFRTGGVGLEGDVSFDEPSPYASMGAISPAHYDGQMFRAKLYELGADPALTVQLIGPLGAGFEREDLERRIHELSAEGVSPATAYKTVELSRMLASSNYVVEFPAEMPISEHVIFPVGPMESRGMEDARFVRFVDDDGSCTYYATYTAFDGSDILPQLIETADFTSFRVATLNGPSASNKGMALFPRKIGGQYAALSRYDKENIDLMFSDEVRHWENREHLRPPVHDWELVQIGNCGSPLETEAGWLVLTHGVGPMRTYSIGALLLDLDDPERVLGALDEPLLTPDDSERNGYVPNVVYSCGGMLHDGLLVLPFGFSDAGIRVALADLDSLLGRLTA